MSEVITDWSRDLAAEECDKVFCVVGADPQDSAAEGKLDATEPHKFQVEPRPGT